MTALFTTLIVLALIGILALSLSLRIVKQYEKGVLFRLGRVLGVRGPGLRIITMPIQSQGIITRDNVSVDISAVAYFKPLMSTIGELGSFLAREQTAAGLAGQALVVPPAGSEPLSEPLLNGRSQP